MRVLRLVLILRNRTGEEGRNEMTKEVRVQLTEAQKAKIKDATGKAMSEIRVSSLKETGLKEQGLKEQGLKEQGLKEQGLKEQGLKEQGLKEQGLKEAGLRSE